MSSVAWCAWLAVTFKILQGFAHSVHYYYLELTDSTLILSLTEEQASDRIAVVAKSRDGPKASLGSVAVKNRVDKREIVGLSGRWKRVTGEGRKSHAMMKSEDPNQDDSNDHQQQQEQEQQNGENLDEGDASRHEEGSVDGSEAGFHSQAGNVDESVNGHSSIHGVNSKEPRKLQRPIQRGAQACRWCTSSHFHSLR